MMLLLHQQNDLMQIEKNFNQFQKHSIIDIVNTYPMRYLSFNYLICRLEIFVYL